jgi:gliding motility-associated-like protein
MKRFVILLVLAFQTWSCFSQVNLVSDPGFEIFSACPSTYVQLELSTGWDTLRNGGGGLPSLFTRCCSNPTDCGVPYNVGNQGYQYPHSDSSYAGLFMFQNTTFIDRDYIQNKLNHKLVAGKTYCLKYYINLHSSSEYAIDQIGAYFDDGTVSSPPWGICNVTPQIITPAGVFYNDTLNWTLVSGTYTANGTEQYLTIGNFKSNALTDTLQFNPNAPRIIAEYNIDDVSLIATDVLAWAHNDTTICTGDSLMLGRMPEIGLDCTWLDTLGHVLGNKANLWVKPSVTQKYIVQQDNCITTYDTVTITVKPKLRNLVVSSDKNTVCQDSLVQLRASAGGAGTGLSWQWTPSTGLSNPNAPLTSTSVQQNQTYVLTVTAPSGYCPPRTMSDSVHIAVKDCSIPFSISVPNVFTPNGDGVNDSWLPVFINSSAITSYHCALFDRWGVALFETDKALQSWDGKNKTGVACIAGTYYYTIEISYLDGTKNTRTKNAQGFFELIR